MSSCLRHGFEKHVVQQGMELVVNGAGGSMRTESGGGECFSDGAQGGVSPSWTR